MTLEGDIDGVDILPEMCSAISNALGCDPSALGSLEGRIEAHFRVGYDPATSQPWTFDVAGQLDHGRITAPRLPHPLTEVQATVHLDNQGFFVRDLKARSSQAVLSLTCSGGLAPSSPMDVEAAVGQLPLDDHLLAVLPGDLQEEWRKAKPEGQVDARIKLHYDGRAWQPQVRIDCRRQVAFTYGDFPFRLEQGDGWLELKDDRLRIDLRTVSENQLVCIAGDFLHPGKGAAGGLRVACNELPIDEKLLRAMPSQAQSLVRSLALRGTVGLTYDYWREVPQGPEHEHLLLRASGCGLRYDGFPYPVSNASGEVEMSDGNWWFRKLSGCNGTTCVNGDGTLTHTSHGDELVLRLSATKVPLGELRDALPPGIQQVWDLVKPRGTVDIAANVRYDPIHLLDVTVRAVPQSETCTLEPVQFPYHLENVQGVFTYSSSGLRFDRFSAWHGPVKIACDGLCTFRADGGWQLSLDRLAVDRLRMDRAFLQAVPPQLKKGLADLNATGPMSLQGWIVLARGANPAVPITAQWDLNVGLNQMGADCGVRLENIYGKVGVKGWSDGTQFKMCGELAIDSLTYRDHQFTQVRGPFWVDDGQAIFGSDVAAYDKKYFPQGQRPATSRRVTAKIFGGSVYGDGQTRFGPQPRFNIQAWLVNADLAACARELGSNNRNLRGRIFSDVKLGGVCHNPTALAGNGHLYLREANIYELPVMISMLKILSIKAPDPNAFSTSDINFHVEGEHFYFDKLDFNGDAISLSGKGQMNFQGNTDVVLAATIGRADAAVPALRKFFSGASQQFMQIHVTGNLQNPDIRQEALPVLNRALKDLDSISRTGNVAQ
jgi:hypothetical protein